ncbi:Hint domain-containing protein [Roseobacter sp. CCS2]|uniref:Hint domain-containing protein n=1 Tax=Roseobacter sp. CCS2 TaxID=391593 RepID=UPI0000F3E0FE|nr:Hint domain-containing protein [Roseobacter sp. CCS2]EBA12014.1 Hemolysin-type calcium-binding region [Roseobacter sp. CCS2]
MAIFEFGIWSTTNLLGGTPIGTGQTNGNAQNGDTFTIGTEDAQTIVVDDQDDGVFEDNTNQNQFLNESLTVNGFTYPPGTQVQNEFIMQTDVPDPDGGFVQIIVLRFNPPGNGNSDLSTTAYTLTGPIPEGTTFEITGVSNNVTGAGAPPYPSFICFAAGTMVQTDTQEVPIETLVAGDLVMTLDHGLQPVRWVGLRSLNPAELSQNPHLRPIRIAAGTFAAGVPARDLLVSPQHRIFVRSKIAMRMFDETEVLVHAKHLLDLPGVAVADDLQEVTYVHAMCDDHEIILADGAYAETLYTGTEAIKVLTPDARAEIAEVFGEVPYLERSLARPSPKGRLSRKLVERHVKNNKSLLQEL